MIRRLGHVHVPFPAVFVTVFLFGGVLRVAPQAWASMHPSAPAAVPQYMVIDSGDESPAPQNARARVVVDFYRAVINGDFDQAFDLSRENRWVDRPGQPARVVGLTSRATFVNALDGEIGSEGLPAGIVRLAVDWERPLSRATTPSQDGPELQALQDLPSGTRIGAVYQEHITGKLVGACSIGTFSRTDIVARLNGAWRLLLPGQVRPQDPHFEVWFLPGATHLDPRARES
jgi:hypothetical protein